MKLAVDKVRSRESSSNEASMQYSVPKATLFRQVWNRNEIAQNGRKYLGRFSPAFDEKSE